MKHNKRCDLCLHWDYVYPEDIGICKSADEPQKIYGFRFPINQAFLPIERITANKGRVATTNSTSCTNFDFDKTKSPYPDLFIEVFEKNDHNQN